MNSQIFSIGNVIDANRSFTASNPNDRSGNGVASVVSLKNSTSVQQDKQSNQAQYTAQEQPSIKEVEQQAQQLNEFIKQAQLNLEYSVDDESGFIVITVTEQDTGEFVRQIPAEEFIAIASLLSPKVENQEVTSGLLIADKV